jgi:predicted alpha/beta-fold hydrolase
LDWLKQTSPHKPIIVLNPGVTGCSESIYLKQLAGILRDKGYTICALNNRGINCEMAVRYDQRTIF